MSYERDCERNRTKSKGSRNERFESDEQPFDDEPSLSLLGATGAFKFLGPTSALYSWSGWKQSHHYHPESERRSATERSPLLSNDDRQQNDSDEEQDGEPEGHFPAQNKDDTLGFVWRSRDNRKGRHALVLRRDEAGDKQPHGTLQPTNTLSATVRGIGTFFTKFPYWDVSWCVATVYTVGSMVWVANGFTAVLPYLSKHSSEEMQSANTWTAFAGASIFMLGSYLLFLEAINANRGGCFGWAIEQTMKGGRLEAEADEENNTNETRNSSAQDAVQEQASRSEDTVTCEAPPPAWLWWPSWRDVRTHFIYQIGFIACAIQLVSGAFFFLTKFTTLPGITEYIPQTVLDITNWAPQVVGCCGFIAAAWLFMLETQPRWYIPAPCVLGWHVGFWKLIGSVGFLLSTVFGPIGQHGVSFAARQSSIAGFWGSWAMLIGSLVQWYESLNKHPVIQEGTHQYSEWNEHFVEKSAKRRG
ncbi:hypothetical protein CC79DRAFT_1265049 [Sarocladium strictum]